MPLLRPTAIIAAFLIIAGSIPPSLFSQTAPKPSQPKQPAPRGRQAKRSQRADALASTIKELLEANPLAPQSPDEKASEVNASEDEDKPPADDAPIKELVDYWSQGHSATTPKPSDKVRQRLLEACEDRPELLTSLMDYLPENTDMHDRLYKLLNEESEDEETWKPRVREWLRRNSAYFRDELTKVALASDNNNIYIFDVKEDLRALARLDWNAARPILETLASAGKVVVTPVALTLLYEHAAKEGDSARAESYRALLKAIVENRQAIWIARWEGLTSLTGPEWSGQEEWFISLFADPTLSSLQEDEVEYAAESKDGSSVKTEAAKGAVAAEVVAATRDIDFRTRFQPGILETVLLGDTGRWLPIVSNLVGINHRTVHKAAVKCLVKFMNKESGDEKKKKEIAQKLIPLLTEPSWAAMEDRYEFIRSLAGLNMPELAPGLIWILDFDEKQECRAIAAEALTKYRDPRSIPALRRALEKENDEWNRRKIITALAECGGFSDDELAAAVEAYAREVAMPEGDQKSVESSGVLTIKTLPLKVSIGRILNDSETIQATEGLAVRLIERARALRATEPAVAREILRTIEAAPLRVVEINLVERIGDGWADVDSVTLALETRDTLIKSAGDELYGLIKEGGYAAGVAAAILHDEREWKAMLENGDAKTKVALLACARYLRDILPFEIAAKLLHSPNRALAKAAESYLEIVDSAEARKLILARHPGEAYILGDLTAISNADEFIEAARKGEDALRKEVRGRNGLDAIYAFTQIYSPENPAGVIIRVRGGKAEMSVYETQGRRNVRWLTDSEFEELKSFTSRQEIEELGPESYPEENVNGTSNYEYLRLTKESGRRVVIDDLRRAPKNPTLHEKLSGLFYRLSRSGEFTARYNIEDNIPGVEAVFADKNRSVLKVCAEGGEMRALIEEKGDEYRRGGAKAAPEWHEFSSGKPGEVRDEPSACHKLNAPLSAPKNATVISHTPAGRPAQSEEALFYATSGKDAGIWKAGENMEPVKIVSGDYRDPVITPDGKWLVAIKQVTEEGKTARQLIRRNLKSGDEFVVTSAQNTVSYRLVYVAAHGKVLLEHIGSYTPGGKVESGNESYLLDPETGTAQPVKGEFRLLHAPLSRPPQSAGAPNLSWATIWDWEKKATRFGRYDSKNFAFTSLLEIPELTLSDDDIWVDAASGKIWFVYRGHLLRLPLPQKTK